MTITLTDAPEADTDGLRLVSLPEGVLIPRIADWAVAASLGGTPESERFGLLALACIAVARDLEEGHDGTDANADYRARRLGHFNRMLGQIMADIGPINLAVTPAQARQIADAFHPVGTPARTVELDPAIVWDLLDQAGHGDHGGWTHDSRWPDVTCACGEIVFRIGVPAPTGR